MLWHTMKLDELHRGYRQPLYLALLMALGGEVVIWLVYGLIWFPEGGLVRMLIWSLTCGIAMGAVTGTFVDSFVVGRHSGTKAILLSTAIFVGVMGVACNAVCFTLGRQLATWGAHTHPGLFIVGGLFLSIPAGLLYSYLLFSKKGQVFLARVGL
jgi:hypothetical protein